MCKDKKKNYKEDTGFSKSYLAPLFNLSGLAKKKVEVSFTMEETSNDGGLLLLKEVDNQIGLIDSLIKCLQDDRH